MTKLLSHLPRQDDLDRLSSMGYTEDLTIRSVGFRYWRAKKVESYFTLFEVAGTWSYTEEISVSHGYHSSTLRIHVTDQRNIVNCLTTAAKLEKKLHGKIPKLTVGEKK